MIDHQCNASNVVFVLQRARLARRICRTISICTSDRTARQIKILVAVTVAVGSLVQAGPSDAHLWRPPSPRARTRIVRQMLLIPGRNRFPWQQEAPGIGHVPVLCSFWLRLCSQGKAAHRHIVSMRERMREHEVVVAGREASRGQCSVSQNELRL